MNGQAGSGGTEIPGLMYMYPSTEQDMGMRMVVIRPRDSINLLDLGLSVKSVFNYDIINKVIGVELSSNFGPPVSDMTGELVSDRFEADGTPKTTYNNYTVVAVGTKAGGPQVPTGASDLDTLFLSVAPDKSFTTIQDKSFSSPAFGNPTVGEFLSTAMRFGCNCPDYLARRLQLIQVRAEENVSIHGVQDLKPGTYDAVRL